MALTGRGRIIRSFPMVPGIDLSGTVVVSDSDRFAQGDGVVRFLNAARPDRGIEADSVAEIREELSGITDLSRVAAGRRYLGYLETVHHAKTDAIANL